MRWFLIAVDLSRKLGNELPSRDSTPLQATLKTIGAIDTIRTSLWPSVGDPSLRYASQRGLTRQRNAAFVQLFFHTELHKCFSLGNVRISENVGLVDAVGPLGRFVFVKNDFADSYESVFYTSPHVDMPAVLHGLWEQYGGRMYASTTVSAWGEVTFDFSPIAETSLPLFGEASSRMDKLLARHRRYKAQGVPRSYMLYGPPGTGKSCFATVFAERLGERTLRLNASALAHATIKDVSFLLNNLAPEFLIIDDIDKVDVSNTLPALLESLQRLKSIATTTLMTANIVSGFDKGLLRPGRIDTWLEFAMPNRDERCEVLREYALLFDVEISLQQVEALADVTDTLSHDYLRELILELRQCGSFDDVVQSVPLMRSLLASVLKNSATPEPKL